MYCCPFGKGSRPLSAPLGNGRGNDSAVVDGRRTFAESNSLRALLAALLTMQYLFRLTKGKGMLLGIRQLLVSCCDELPISR